MNNISCPPGYQLTLPRQVGDPEEDMGENGEEALTPDNEIVIEVENGTVTGGIQRLAVEIGDQVRITIVSESDDMFHLHAYDLELSLKAGQPETLQFQADIPGVFEGELHEAGYQIFALEVS